MVSIRTVAEKAGVGAGTVSRALNGSGYVAKETKDKIMAVVEELGYQPNELAKNLLKNRSGIIGVMVPDLEHPFFARIMRCMETELFRRGYKCLVCNTLGIMDRQGGFLEMLGRNMVDGIVACVDALPGFQGKKEIPIVAFDRNWGEEVVLVRSEHEEGARLAAERFLERGCRHVAQFFSSGRTGESANIRHLILERLLEERGCRVTNINISWDAMSYEYNRTVVWKYMDVLEGIDGIMTTDVGAMSCLAVAQKKAIKIPEQMKIIGYDGTEITNIVYPQLTAVVQDCEKIAKACISSLLELIEGQEPEKREILIPVGWQEGGTT